tara:strand:+ start:17691 stop:18290 length:600 start_codon:yes stop_codon:yes gene_type:complete
MDEIKKRILNKVRDLFFRKGFGKVTMDELAAELGMSKKTLYNHFSNKQEMLTEVIRDLKNDLTIGADRIMLDDTLSFTDKLSGIMSFLGQTLGNMELDFLVDLKKSNPSLSKELENYKTEAVFNRFSNLLEEGIRKGYVRADINKSMAVMLYASVVEMAANPEYINKIPDHLKGDIPYHSAEIYKGLVEVMLNGILKEE